MAKSESTEISTLPTLSHDAQRLVELHARWAELRGMRAQTLPETAFVEAVQEVIARVIEHRARLFEVIAELNVAPDADTPEGWRRYEANRDAVKFCTVLLGDMHAAIASTSPLRPQG